MHVPKNLTIDTYINAVTLGPNSIWAHALISSRSFSPLIMICCKQMYFQTLNTLCFCVQITAFKVDQECFSFYPMFQVDRTGRYLLSSNLTVMYFTLINHFVRKTIMFYVSKFDCKQLPAFFYVPVVLFVATSIYNCSFNVV